MSENRKDVNLALLEAVEKPTAQERAAYLDEVCRDDPALRAELESLLVAHDKAGGFLEVPILEPAVSPASSPLSEGPGTPIGRYKLLERIGEGGMAVVYMAEQTQPIRRKVALKIIKLGMDTKQVIARFEAERQALAIMDHPNIAGVLDAGATETGRPYFAMELVTGVSITEYCDKNRLNTKERLALFTQVCHAVQHAHQKGIIHRDIKPSNVMVTHRDGKPVPKVIDFGIAKATNQRLTEKTLFTRYAHIIGTPAYMSPEQAELSETDIDTRSDIYSLGVLLYELLTGTTPFSEKELRQAGYIEMQRVIREEERTRPSTKLTTLGEMVIEVARCRNSTPDLLRKAVRGDLDWIVMKSLEKDRTCRYETAHGLAEDIQRHQNHEPVQAASPSMTYHLRKYARKHRTELISASGILAAVLLALVLARAECVQRAELQSMARQQRELQIASQLSAAQRHQAEGHYQDALAQLEVVLWSATVPARARLLHGQLLFDMGRGTEAQEQLKGLLAEPPEIAGTAHALLARIHDAWESSLAEEHRRQAESLLQQTAEAYSLRAMAAMTPEEALVWLDKALKLEPDHFLSRQARALVYYASRNFAGMELDAEAMIVIRPKDIMGYTLRAIVHEHKGNLDHAIEDVTRAIELSDIPLETAKLHDRRRALHLLTDDLQAALRDAQQCVSLRPADLQYCFNRFAALLALGHYREAIQAYDAFTGNDAQQRGRFLYELKKYAFHLLGTGRPIEFLPEVAHHPALAALREGADYYHHLAAKARHLLPQTLSHGSWSPDGRQIVYSQTYVHPHGAEALAALMPTMALPGGIEVLNPESGARRSLISFGIYPAWSPDGRWIAFAKTQKGTWGGMDDKIWIINAEGSESRCLGKGTMPFWGFDTQRLYFLAPDESTLYRIRVDEPAATPERVTSCPGWYPSMSPDERYLTYAVENELRLVDLSTGTVTTLWTAPAQPMHVQWSPRGTELSVGGSYGSPLGVWIFDMQTRQAWHVFDPPAFKLSWSADGSRVALHVHQPFEEIWWTQIDPNVPTYEALAPARTCRDYLRRRRDQHIRAQEKYGHEIEGTLKNLALVAADQCRLGDYQDALETLTDVDTLCTAATREPRPRDIALQAVALFEIEETELARAALGRLRGILEGTTTAAQAFIHSTPAPVPMINSKGREYAPTIGADSLSLFFTSSQGGHGSQDLWVATRSDAAGDWSKPENVGAPVNTSACEAHPCLAADELSLYFCDGRGHEAMPRRPGGLGASDLWVTRRPTLDDPWEEPVNLGPAVNSEHHEHAPFISSDGLTLLFDSDRPGGMGASDIWMATRPSVDDPWKTPVNLGSEINSTSWESEPSLTSDGSSLYFSSLRADGYGGYDTWMARRASARDAWMPAENLGPLVNTCWHDLGPEVSADGSTFYFSSRRMGGPGFWDIWHVSVRQASINLMQEDVLLRLARSIVEAEFGKAVIARQYRDSTWRQEKNER